MKEAYEGPFPYEKGVGKKEKLPYCMLKSCF